MKGAVLWEVNKPLIVETEIKIPELMSGQVLVKLYYSGVCHSQLMEARGKRGKDPYLPHLLGHEGSGQVVAVGGAVPADKLMRRPDLKAQVSYHRLCRLQGEPQVRQTISGVLREVGAREVHVRISSPPTTHSCFYGIDTPTKGELIASNLDIGQTCEYLGADSLHYITLEKMLEIFGEQKDDFCAACFDGRYPVDVTGSDGSTNQLDLF